MSPQGCCGYFGIQSVRCNPFKWKCISIHLEAVFMRSLMQTVDMGVQGDLLPASGRSDRGWQDSTDADRNLWPDQCGQPQEGAPTGESGKTRGKIALEGF
ncbi:hypothetical protein D3C87_1752950 [compost metagenome]